MAILVGIYSHQCNETASLGKAMDVAQSTQIVAMIGPACSDDVQASCKCSILMK